MWHVVFAVYTRSCLICLILVSCLEEGGGAKMGVPKSDAPQPPQNEEKDKEIGRYSSPLLRTLMCFHRKHSQIGFGLPRTLVKLILGCLGPCSAPQENYVVHSQRGCTSDIFESAAMVECHKDFFLCTTWRCLALLWRV